ncbi:pteridine reductase [Methylotuvimicrobium alcaliphilum]|uniref:pteridine reductase n=1 Tax=Methylotuvimicrobium alcaliphilum TaxID=271065 RepID=UPI0009FEBB00|nr:pteridine reductase [Methylotuvimicrobium alcaliphilum]
MFVRKNVLITGGAKRIGAACAKLLHESGFNILLHYRSSESSARQLCDLLNDIRLDSAQTIKADLAVKAELLLLADYAKTAWGGIDALVNNASSFYPTGIGQVSEHDWDELIGSNLKAPFFLTQALIKELSARRGCVVNITDIHAERGLKGYPVYSIAKAGLVAMTRVMAKELGPDIRVNAVSPGAILWPEQDMSEAVKQEIVERIALKRNGAPEDIARAVRFLIKDADYITGQVIAVDGGRTLFC